MIPGVITVLENYMAQSPTYWFTLTLYSPTLQGICASAILTLKVSLFLYGCFRKWWYPQIIQFNRDFHYKSSILGYPYFWKHPYRSSVCSLFGWWRPRFYSRDMLWSPRSGQCQEESHDYALPPAGCEIQMMMVQIPRGKSTVFFFWGGGKSNMYIVIWRNFPLFWIHCLKLRETKTERFTGGRDQIHVFFKFSLLLMGTVRSRNSWLDGTYPFTVYVSIYAISFDVFCLSKVVDCENPSIYVCISSTSISSMYRFPGSPRRTKITVP